MNMKQFKQAKAKQKKQECQECGVFFYQTFFDVVRTKQTMCQPCIEAAPRKPSGWSGDLDAVPPWL